MLPGCNVKRKLVPDNPANMSSKEQTQHEMNPVPICLVKTDIRPPESVESAYSKNSSFPVGVVQRDKNRRDKEGSRSKYKKQ